jgi:hypothetical protein
MSSHFLAQAHERAAQQEEQDDQTDEQDIEHVIASVGTQLLAGRIVAAA